MPVCPRCKKDYGDGLTSCPNCNYEFDDDDDAILNDPNDGWVIIGRVNTQTASDYARETLESYDIPAVIISESGFFGQVGLNLPSPTGKHKGMFQIHVPADCAEEAVGVLDMIFGDSWEKSE